MAYTPPIDDILFALTHMAGAKTLPSWDCETLTEIIEPYTQLMASEIAPLNALGDREGARLIDGRVKLPEGFKEAFQTYAEQGWQGLAIPENYGGHGLDGMGLDNLALALTSEIMSGANHPFQMLLGLTPGLARVLLRFGTEDQKQRYLPMIASGETLATMALTEPQAGSDLARIKCGAQHDGSVWRLSGEKIFISNGDQDASARITHLVLARTSDEGVKGLSLFLCPDRLEDGNRNAVQILRIEEKLGLKASPTCHMAFNDAEAEIIGEPGQGLSLMFTMMNHARLDVSLQGAAHASRAYQLARSYAEDRVQGGRPIARHPDVTRMLERSEYLAWSARAIAHLGYVEMDRGERAPLVDVLTPLAKVYCSNAGTQAADLAIQTLGGYGYLKEYGVEQILRDSRICAIYEGANGVHEAALVTRQLKAGTPYAQFADLLGSEEALAEPLEAWRGALVALIQQADPREIAHEFFEWTSCLLLSWLWLRAQEASDAYQWPDKINNFRQMSAIDLAVAQTRFNVTLAQRMK